MTLRLRLSIVLVLVPALVMSALWNWARDRSRSTPIETIPVSAEIVEQIATGGTPVLSARRVGDAVVASAARSRRAEMLDAIVDTLGEQGCLVVESAGVPLVNHRTSTAIPAPATLPILVAAAAVERLGSEWRPQTLLIGPEPVDGVIGGDLYLVGGGDPFLGSIALSGPSTTSGPRLDAIVGALVAIGVTEIDGDVVADDGRYPDIARLPGAPIAAAALITDGGRILTSPVNRGLDPAQTAARAFDELLRRSGVTVSGTVRVAQGVANGVTLAVLEGDRIADGMSVLVDDADLASMVAVWNWMMETAATVAPPEGLAEAASTVRTTISDWGVPPPDLALPGSSTPTSTTCTTLSEAANRLELGLGSLDAVSTAVGPTISGIEGGGDDSWMLARATTSAGATVTAIGSRDALLSAIEAIDELLADATFEVPVAAVAPVDGDQS